MYLASVNSAQLMIQIGVFFYPWVLYILYITHFDVHYYVSRSKKEKL